MANQQRENFAVLQSREGNIEEFEEQQMLFSRISGEQIEKLRRELKRSCRERAKVEKTMGAEILKLEAELVKCNEKVNVLTNDNNHLKSKNLKLLQEMKAVRDSNEEMQHQRRNIDKAISEGVEKESRRLLNEMRDSFLKHSVEEKERMDSSLQVIKEVSNLLS